MWLVWLIVATAVVWVVLLYGLRDLCPSCGREQGSTDLYRLSNMLFGRRKTCAYCGAKLDRTM